MSNKKRSSKRLVKVPARFDNHAVEGLSQKRDANAENKKLEDSRVEDGGSVEEVGGIGKDTDGVVFGNMNKESILPANPNVSVSISQADCDGNLTVGDSSKCDNGIASTDNACPVVEETIVQENEYVNIIKLQIRSHMLPLL